AEQVERRFVALVDVRLRPLPRGERDDPEEHCLRIDGLGADPRCVDRSLRAPVGFAPAHDAPDPGFAGHFHGMSPVGGGKPRLGRADGVRSSIAPCDAAVSKRRRKIPKSSKPVDRIPRMTGNRFLFGPYLLDPARGTVLRDGTALAIGQRGLALLRALLEASGQTLTKAELMDAAWPHVVVEESNLSVQVAALRRLLGPAPDGSDWIATVARIGYRFTAPVTVLADAKDDPADAPAPARSGKPSIAVLPFENLSGDPAQDYFADGVTEDIITALARFRWFLVVSRNSSFAFRGRPVSAAEIASALGVRYLLEGSVRRSAGSVRIAAHLVDAASAIQLWAERYDFEGGFAVGDMFSMQDRIAERVAGAIEPELLKTESALAARRPRHGSATGWDLVHR